MAGFLVHGNALPCQSRLIDRAASLYNHSIHRDIFSGTHHENIALCHLFNGNGLLLPVLYDAGSLGSQFHQIFQSIRGFSLGAGLQHLPDCNQGQDHGGRFKVEFMHIPHHCSHVTLHLGICHGKQGVGAVNEGCAGAESNQGIHVRRPVPQALKTAYKKFLVNHHHRDCQKELQKPHSYMVCGEKGRNRPPPHHMSHGKIHENEEKAKGPEKPPFQHRGFPVFQHLLPRTGTCSPR